MEEGRVRGQERWCVVARQRLITKSPSILPVLPCPPCRPELHTQTHTHPHTHTNRQTQTRGQRSRMTAQSEWRRKEITLWFPLLLPSVILDSWQMVCHRPQVSTGRLPSPFPNVSLFFPLIFISAPVRLCLLFLFLSPRLSSPLFRRSLYQSPWPSLNPVKPFIHQQHVPSSHALLNQLSSDIDPMFPQCSHSPCLIPGWLYGALLLGLSLHPAPYCDPPEQFKDKPANPKSSGPVL